MKITIKTVLAACMLLTISCSKGPLRNPQAASTQMQDNGTLQTTSHHYIGEHFGGGIIFYIDSIRHYGLIADTLDLPQTTWANGGYTRTWAGPKVIGGGQISTNKILEVQGEPLRKKYVAYECKISVRSGYNDWFLPSRDELNELYKQKNIVGGFVINYYWSSSEVNINYAWIQNFNHGHQAYGDKEFQYYSVRAIRAFSY